MKRKQIGFLVFDGVMGLDLIGPMDAFACASVVNGDRSAPQHYELITIGLTRRPVRSEAGARFCADTTLPDAPPLDTLIIPGGQGLWRPKIDKPISRWLRTRASSIRRIVSICTGIHALASAGLLDHRRATTHWRFANEIARCFPKIKIDPNPLFVKDGKFYTSAGVTAGIDLSLALIEEDCGPGVALAVARDLVVYLKRPGDQEQYSAPLQFQVRSTDRFADIATWLVGHLHEDLSEEALARRSAYSPRHFRRLFKQTFGRTSARFVEELRLTEARYHLSIPRNNVDSVGESVGFKNRQVFSRAFARRFGIPPSGYRQRFHSSTSQFQ